jgi:hypothetical protein
MKYTLTAAMFLSAVTIAPAYGQAWLGQVIAESAAAQEQLCMRGETRPPSERRLTTIRETLAGAMTRYLTLAAASESSDVSSLYTRRGRTWVRTYATGADWDDVESVNDQLARTAGATLDRASTVLLAGDGSTAAGQWILRDTQSQTIGYYRGVFRRERGDWRLLRLEVYGADTRPTSLVAYCHDVGDVSPGEPLVVPATPAATLADEPREAAPATL